MNAPRKESEKIVETVREQYANIAIGEQQSCCGPISGCCDSAGSIASGLGYKSADLDLLPEGTNLGLGCGAPLDVLSLKPGEAVLDLGAGAGVDALIAARQVGLKGSVIGVDMTPEMIEKAQANAEAAGLANVEFRHGRLENLPVEDASIDAVTSNCVINLVPDKARVFSEIVRVLRPNGRVAISDVVLDGPLPDAITQDDLAYVGCVAGAIERTQYFSLLQHAGLVEVSVEKDMDFGSFTAAMLPAEAQELLDRSEIDFEDVWGLIRSVTFVARKPQGCDCD